MAVDDNIHRPLGQNQKSKVPNAQKKGKQRWLIGVGFLGLVAISAAISLAGRDVFRTPVPTPEAAPETVVTADAKPPASLTQNAAGTPDVNGTAPGPKIITVQDPARIGQDQRTAHLPLPELIETSPHGSLPIRGADGTRPMDAYARGWSGARGARVAIVVGGLGLSQTGTLNAIEALPDEVTLAFAPHGNSLQRWMQNARQNGHEVLMQVPLEPFDYPKINPGRNTLTVDAKPAENLERLHWAMGRITNYTGIMNYMGGRFTSDPAAMTPVMQEIGKRGLLYLDDGTSARSQSDAIAGEQAVPFAASDLLIDGQQDRGAILKKLDELERIARAKGTAVGTGSAFPATVEAISAWANEARARGVEIVPISALVRDPERR